MNDLNDIENILDEIRVEISSQNKLLKKLIVVLGAAGNIHPKDIARSKEMLSDAFMRKRPTTSRALEEDI